MTSIGGVVEGFKEALDSGRSVYLMGPLALAYAVDLIIQGLYIGQFETCFSFLVRGQYVIQIMRRSLVATVTVPETVVKLVNSFSLGEKTVDG